ncbi:hypothetical protein GGI23_005231, partial [Coemansia sp. RSA 2559]
MLLKKLFPSTLLLTLGLVLAQGAPVAAKTHILDKNNFESTTKQGTWIVKHFSPICPHCRTFKPKWDNAVSARAEQLVDQDVHFGELDCYQNYKLCQQNGVTAWPAVIAFRNGKRYAYTEGDKSEQDSLDFIDQAVKDAAGADQQQKQQQQGARKYKQNSVVLDAANYTQHANSGVWLVKHYSPYCPHCNHMKPEWIKMTDELAADLAADGILFGE